mmetsp:Transcript_13142/g.27744  ORF Transcript_13142/g.27744 Transcript_13142/m.27744 type:complete len:129 (+) Transcript_13142:332-718(+)
MSTWRASVRLNRRLTSAVAGAAKRQGPVERRISNTVRCAAYDASFDAHDVAPEGPESPVQKMSRKTATNVFISVPMSVLGLFGVGKNSRRNPSDLSMYEYMYDEESPGHMNYHSGVADKLASEHCNLD